MQGKLSKTEKRLIRKVAKLQQKSFIRIADTDFSEIFGEGIELGEYTNLDLAETLVDELQFFEEMERNPNLIFKIDEMNLRVVQFILAQQILVNKYPDTIRELLNKLDIVGNNLKALN